MFPPGSIRDPADDLAISRIEPEPDDEPAREFDGKATTCRGPRTRTIDPLIEFLRKQ